VPPSFSWPPFYSFTTCSYHDNTCLFYIFAFYGNIRWQVREEQVTFLLYSTVYYYHLYISLSQQGGCTITQDSSKCIIRKYACFFFLTPCIVKLEIHLFWSKKWHNRLTQQKIKMKEQIKSKQLKNELLDPKKITYS
jgi:hypothetical protein